MADAHPILVAALAGFICSVIFSSLPGPINLTILNEGAARGFKWGLLIGLGAMTMDTAYCAVSFTGLAQLMRNDVAQTTMRVMGFVFLLFLGGKFLRAKPAKEQTKIREAIEKIEEHIEQKLHPHTAFALGFVRVAANLGVLVAWIVLSATLMSTTALFSTKPWVANSVAARTICVVSVCAGTLVWFIFWSYLVARGHGKFSAKSLVRLQHCSGLVLIGIALYEGGHIAWQLSKH